MRRRPYRILFLAVSMATMLGHALAQAAPPGYSTSTNLPSGFAALVPKGFKLSSAQTTTAGNSAGVSFTASKPDPQHSAVTHEYRLNLDLRMTASQLIQMQEPAFRAQLEHDIEAKRQSCSSHASNPSTGYDSAVVTKYPWGYGITQRLVHHYIGAGSGADAIAYQCEYLGLIIDDTTVKKFELLAGGVKTSAEADQWAKMVAEKIGKTTLANFKD